MNKIFSDDEFDGMALKGKAVFTDFFVFKSTASIHAIISSRASLILAPRLQGDNDPIISVLVYDRELICQMSFIPSTTAIIHSCRLTSFLRGITYHMYRLYYIIRFS